MTPRFQEPEKKGNFELLEGSTENNILMKEFFFAKYSIFKEYHVANWLGGVPSI
jgi:hypothetical protein